MTLVEVIIALFLPFLAVLLRKAPCMEVVWAFLLQLLGHLPGVVYALWIITQDPQTA